MTPVALGRFEREAKTAAGLRHPNIVTVYAVGRERGMPFLAMEYVNGPSLATVLGRAGAAVGGDDSHALSAASLGARRPRIAPG